MFERYDLFPLSARTIVSRTAGHAKNTISLLSQFKTFTFMSRRLLLSDGGSESLGVDKNVCVQETKIIDAEHNAVSLWREKCEMVATN